MLLKAAVGTLAHERRAAVWPFLREKQPVHTAHT